MFPHNLHIPGLVIGRRSCFPRGLGALQFNPAVRRLMELLARFFAGEFLAGAFEEKADAEADECSEGAHKERAHSDAFELRAHGLLRVEGDAFSNGDLLFWEKHTAGLVAGHVWCESDQDPVDLPEHKADDGADFDDVFSAHGNALERGEAKHGRKK